jgi:hypothetical protein
MLRHTAQDEQVREHVDDVDRLQPSVDADRQAFVGELVDDVEHAIFSPIMGAVLDKVVGPDMVGPLGAKADAGSVREPEPTSFGLSGWNLQPLASPDPLDPLVVDDPACRRAQQGGDLAIAVAAVSADQFDDVGDELLLIVATARNPALGRAVLPEYTADPSLRNLQSEPDMVDAGTATRGAYQFPEAASFRISLSSVRSATARRSRAFSASSSFIRFT